MSVIHERKSDIIQKIFSLDKFRTRQAFVRRFWSLWGRFKIHGSAVSARPRSSGPSDREIEPKCSFMSPVPCDRSTSAGWNFRKTEQPSSRFMDLWKFCVPITGTVGHTCFPNTSFPPEEEPTRSAFLWEGLKTKMSFRNRWTPN